MCEANKQAFCGDRSQNSGGLTGGRGVKGTFLGDRDTLRLVRVLVTRAYVQCKYPYRLVDI